MKHDIINNEVKEDLSLYALGALGQHEALVIEFHLAEGCSACGKEWQKFSTVVRYLAFTADERVPPSALRDRLLDRVLIEEASRSPFPATFLAPLWAGRSKQEKRTMTIHSHEGQWQKLMDGVFAKQLFEDKKRGTTTSLVRMAPGSTIEKHLHSALEECFVLEGDFRVNGERLLAGDYHCALPGSIHEKAVTSEGTLLLVITSTNQH